METIKSGHDDIEQDNIRPWVSGGAHQCLCTVGGHFYSVVVLRMSLRMLMLRRSSSTISTLGLESIRGHQCFDVTLNLAAYFGDRIGLAEIVGVLRLIDVLRDTLWLHRCDDENAGINIALSNALQDLRAIEV
nr:hypothetical protein [Candidatus Reidiella endopervernicosa]